MRPAICYHHSASTAFLESGARPLPAAGTATQPQERLRNALTILHVLRLPPPCSRRPQVEAREGPLI
jgi:hypothetical protein